MNTDLDYISTIEEFNKLPIRGHYNPEKYLSKYKFSQNMLLNIFCTDKMHFCFEDYYYDDFNLNMVKKYQPHINVNEFKKLWNEIDIIREAELHSLLIIELFEENYSVSAIRTWTYELIENYILKIKKHDNNNIFDVIKPDYKKLLKNNKFIQSKKLYDQYEKIETREELIQKAKQIIKAIPDDYTSILPLDS